MALPVDRAATALLVALALAGQMVQLDSLFLDVLEVATSPAGAVHPAVATVITLDALLTLVMAVLAVLLSLHPEARAGARLLALTVAAWGYLLAYPGILALLRPLADSPLRPLFQTHFLLVEMVGLAALVRFTALFPRTLDPTDLEAPGSLPPGMGLLQRVRLWLLRPEAPWIAGALATGVPFLVTGLRGDPPIEAALLALVDAIRFAALSVAVLNLRVGFLRSDAEAREAALWLVAGFSVLVGALAVLMGGNVLTAVTGWRVTYLNWRPVLLDAGLLGFILGTGFAGLHRGPASSGRVLQGVVTGSTAITAGLLLAAGLEALFSDAVVSPLHLPRGVGTGAAVLTLALILPRLHPSMAAFLDDSIPAPATKPSPPSG